MGTWGMGPFENDGANDWAYSLEETSDLGLVESALDAVIASAGDYLEAGTGEIGLAACEVLACMLGRGLKPDAYSKKVHAWVANVDLEPDAAILAKAQSAIDRIVEPGSELRELWEESNDAGAWRSSVQDLRSRLSRT